MGRPEHSRCADRAARERPAPPAALARSADGRGVDTWAVELEGAMGDGVYSRVGSLVSEAESTNRTMRTKGPPDARSSSAQLCTVTTVQNTENSPS